MNTNDQTVIPAPVGAGISTVGKEVEKPLTREEKKTNTKAELRENPVHFGKPVRLGSRKILIQQVEKFSMLPKEAAAQNVRDEVVKKIGSKFAKGSQDVIRGLSPEEEKYYLPRYIGHSSSSSDWNRMAKYWWADFTIPVPIDGIEIEVGFWITENEEGETVIEPISLDGYIKYNFCLVNNDVASTSVENTFHYAFKLVDKAKDEALKEDNFSLIKGVLKTYNMLIQSEDQKEKNKIDWILETAYDIYTPTLSPIQKEMKLKEKMEEDPQKFKEAVSDSQLEMKAFIRKAVQTNSIIKDGESYFVDDKVIGTGVQQAIAFFSNQVNQGIKLKVQERIKNAI